MEINRSVDFLSAAEDFKSVKRSINQRADKSYVDKFNALLEDFIRSVSIDLGLSADLSLDQLMKNKKTKNHVLNSKSNDLYLKFDDMELRYGVDIVPKDIVDFDPAASLINEQKAISIKEKMEQQEEEEDIKKFLSDKKNLLHPLDI